MLDRRGCIALMVSYTYLTYSVLSTPLFFIQLPCYAAFRASDSALSILPPPTFINPFRMSGLDVISSISAIISLLDASIKIYDSAQKDIKLSATFDVVRRRLPVLLHTLETCKNHLKLRKDAIPGDVCEALEKSLDACDAKASNLRGIFEKIIPGESDTWEKRYLKVLRRIGKGNKVEELMRSMAEDVQLIVNHDAVRSANAKQNLELENIIKEMNEVDSSVPNEENMVMTFSSGGGAQTNNLNIGSGQQINNNAPVTTQNFGPGK